MPSITPACWIVLSGNNSFAPTHAISSLYAFDAKKYPQLSVSISTSLLTSEPDYKKIQGLSYGTLTSSDRISSEKSYSTIDVVLSIVLVLIVIGILLFFSPIFFWFEI